MCFHGVNDSFRYEEQLHGYPAEEKNGKLCAKQTLIIQIQQFPYNLKKKKKAV